MLTWWSLPLIFVIVLLFQLYRQPSTIRKRSAAYALGVYVLFVVIGTTHIFSIRSSTAAIGLLFLPLYSLVPGVIAYVLGYFHGKYKDQKLLGESSTLATAGIVTSILFLGVVFSWQLAEIRETAIENTERDSKQAKRNTDIKENKQRLEWTLSRYKGKEVEKLTELVNNTTDDTMLMAIAGSQYAPSDLLDRLSRLNNFGVTLNVIRNSNTVPSTLEWIFYKSSYPGYYYSDLARNINTPTPILRTLYANRHVNGGIAWSLAGNSSTPIDLLKKLASEPDENVHRHLKNNKTYTITNDH